MLHCTCTTTNCYRQYHFTLHSRNLIFVELVDYYLSGFKFALPKIFVNDIILHSTRTTWFSLHSYNLISKFYIWTIWNLFPRYNYTLHSQNLILTEFAQLSFKFLHLNNLNFLFSSENDIFDATLAPWFSLHSQNISVA